LGKSHSAHRKSRAGTPERVEISDIKAKLDQIRGDADTKVEAARSKLAAGAGGAALIAIVVAFWLGKRRGRRKATWVEIRRL
jgi:hypothetical protein